MSTQAEKFRGKFIVIDGPDGAGKSTQLALLAEWLKGRGVSVSVTRDPGGTPIGNRIREILLDNGHSEMAVECELMLYMASRAQLAAEVIRPAMARGDCVLCDRFISATIAYQGAGGAQTETVRSVGKAAVGGLWPDLTIILDLPHAEGLDRARSRRDAGPDRMEAKQAEFHQRVRETFLRQASDDPARFVVIDAGGNVDEVQARLRDAIERWEF